MIKKYCINYEEEKHFPAFASGGWEDTVTTTLHEITIPAPNIVEAINYAINKLKVPYQDIKEVYEL